MAESLLGAVLGGEDEDKAESTKVGSEAIAAAVAANLAIHSPEVAAEAAAFFREQIEVLKVQKKILEAEHEYFETEWGPRLLGIRLRVGFQVFAILAATVIGIGGAIVIRDAINSRSVVIDPFSAPPGARGERPERQSSRVRSARRIDADSGGEPQQCGAPVALERMDQRNRDRCPGDGNLDRAARADFEDALRSRPAHRRRSRADREGRTRAYRARHRDLAKDLQRRDAQP
jgi:hypothetical protein